jgi:hypothetical protein
VPLRVTDPGLEPLFVMLRMLPAELPEISPFRMK